MGLRSRVRTMPELRGRLGLVTSPAAQSALQEAFALRTLTTHVLVAAPPFEELGIGSGGPKRQPAFVHFSKAHFALAQLPLTHIGGTAVLGEQSASVTHGPAQSLLVVQEAPRVAAVVGGRVAVARHVVTESLVAVGVKVVEVVAVAVGVVVVVVVVVVVCVVVVVVVVGVVVVVLVVVGVVVVVVVVGVVVVVVV